MKSRAKASGPPPQDIRCTSAMPELCTNSLSAKILRSSLVSPPRQKTTSCRRSHGVRSSAADSSWLANRERAVVRGSARNDQGSYKRERETSQFDRVKLKP